MTLQDLCLSTIATEVDRYYQAYAAADNADLRRRFQFLQKVYSFRLLSLLNEEDLLQEKYADLVFTKHLRSVDTEWFSKFSWKTVSDTFTKIGPSLENVFFNEESNDMSWENIICHLPNVKAITYQAFCSDGILECVAKYCPRLETLDIKRSYDVTDDGLKYFYQKEQGKVPCPLLKEIFVESTLVHNECIKHILKNLPLLEKIDYSELPEVLHIMHVDAFDSLDKVEKYNLIHLNLLNCVHVAHMQCYDEILEICVTVCPKLKSFYCPVFKLEHLSLCSKLSDVEDLNLNCVNDIGIDVNDVLKEKGGKLTSLTLRNCSVSLPVLGQCCVRLNQLTMNLVNIQYNENDSIPMFCNLKELAVENGDLSNPGSCKAVCRILSSSSALEKLHLKKCKSFTSEMKSKILKCCEQCPLKLIDFGGSSVETEFLKDILLTCSTLEALNLDDCNMELEYEDDLYRIAETMPNRPEIIFTDELSYFSDYGELLNDYEDYLDNTDDEDEDDNYLDYDDEYYDDEDHIYYM